VEPLLVNPPARELGRFNSILTGRSCRYSVREFPGPLSVKSVIEGSATWQCGPTRHTIDSSSALILNDGEPYSIEIESLTPVETFCIFFRRGFVEDAVRIARRPAEELLDDPWCSPPVLLPRDGAVMGAMRACRRDPENGLFMLAETLAGLRRLPSIKPATRDELLRRVLRGRDYIEGNLGGSLLLAETARVACLSTFHFHRTFRAVFGEAPHQYAVRRRLENAADALRKSDETVTGVALRCGFETPSSFATAFRKHFGCAPTAIRKNGKAPDAIGERQ
jgi:AraC-like DNA-binding protein